MILTTPAIIALREKFPGAEISLVLSQSSRELLPAIPGLTKSFVARGTLADAGRWLQLLGRGYDCCIDFTGNDRSAFFTSLSHARKRITHVRVRRSRVRALAYNEYVDSPVRLVHTTDHNLALLAPLGICDADATPRLDVPDGAETKAAGLLEAARVTGNFVVIHPGSARAEKFWMPDRWAKIIDHCADKFHIACVLTGGSSAMEQSHIAEIKRQTRHPFPDLSGKMDLLTLAALIRRARLLAGVDSAPMHLASAMGTTQVILFGPTNPFHWRPRSTAATILSAGRRDPVVEFSPDHEGRPMNEISTEQVIDVMQSLLSSPVAKVV